MMKKDKSFEHDVAEYMLTRFVDYLDTNRKNIHIVYLPKGEKNKVKVLSNNQVSVLIKDYARYIDKRLNRPTVNKFRYDMDKRMSFRFKKR